MKIGIDARIISTSTGRYVERLLEYLQQLDRINEYVVLLRKADFDTWQPKAANFRKVISDYPPYTFAEQLGFAYQLYRLDLDLVHFTMPQHPLLYLKRHIITVHDLTLVNYVNRRQANPLLAFYKFRIKPWVFKSTLAVGLKEASQILTDTDYVRQQLVSKFKLAPSKVIRTYMGVDPLAAAAKAVPELENKPFLLYVGNAYPYKNVGLLLDAMASLADRKLWLVVAGKPDQFYQDLQVKAGELGLTKILFTGFVPDEQLMWLYQHARLYLFPSLSEGFGLPGIEAMQNGLPVASSNASCLPEVYADAAAYFNPRDADALAKMIAELLDDPEKLRRLRDAGKARAKLFSWKTTAEQTLSVYSEVLGR